MSDSTSLLLLPIVTFTIGLLLAVPLVFLDKQEVQSEQFRGNSSIAVYQVYDIDTGVCYAVTNKGGICVMMTQDGSVKLINQGEPPTIHKNQE